MSLLGLVLVDQNGVAIGIHDDEAADTISVQTLLLHQFQALSSEMFRD